MVSDFEPYAVRLHEDLGQFAPDCKIDVLRDGAVFEKLCQRCCLRDHNGNDVTGCVKYRTATVSTLNGSGDLQQCVIVAGPGDGVDLAECRLGFRR